MKGDIRKIWLEMSIYHVRMEGISNKLMNKMSKQIIETLVKPKLCKDSLKNQNQINWSLNIAKPIKSRPNL